MPSKVLIGIRVKIDSSALKSVGRLMIGSWRGRNPRVVDTIKAGRVVSSGLVSRRTLKDNEGAREPILEAVNYELVFGGVETAVWRC